MQWPFVPRSLYRNVLRQLAKETRRAEGLSEDLRLERSENRLAERHWSNQFLRKMNAYPQQPTREEIADQPKFIAPPKYDPGELTAVIAEAARLGVAEKEAREMFAREKGIDAKLIH